MKTTRKSFSRKSILVIVSIFLAISLTATGFAAWLISNDADDSVNGNVNVSNVSDAILGVTVGTINETVRFAPQGDDEKGNVRYDKTNAPDDVENLKFKVSGSIKRFQTLKNMEVTVNCTDDILTAAGYTWSETESVRTYTYTAAAAFIALPEFAMDSKGNKLPLPGETDKYTTAKVVEAANEMFKDKPGTTTNEKTFEFEVSFGWGALFEGKNPGRYLDEEGVTISAANKTNLLKIANDHQGEDIEEPYPADKPISAYAKRDILNYMYSLVNKTETTTAPATTTYTVVIKAVAN